MDKRNRRKVRVGIVVSDKMDKTVRVETIYPVTHERYGRIIRQRSMFVAHDEKEECKIGDKVLIMETRPLSKTKRWRVVKIIEKAK